jgi:hypothetical protein
MDEALANMMLVVLAALAVVIIALLVRVLRLKPRAAVRVNGSVEAEEEQGRGRLLLHYLFINLLGYSGETER